MIKINWQMRDDNVIYFEPVGFTDSYYIYPPQYDDENQELYILSQIDHSGNVVQEYQNANIDELKNIVVNNITTILNLIGVLE